jgi:hypothetical protein
MEFYTVEFIANKAQKHRSSINKIINKLGIKEVHKQNIGKARIPYYSKEQMDLILNSNGYKRKIHTTIIEKTIIETYHIYESKINYDDTI